MRSSRQKTTAAAACLVAVALGFAAWFLAPAWARTRPHAPFPLDDVYIHLDYARSFRLTEPFAWLPGQGYSSGETAPLYAVLLSTARGLGLDGLGYAATALAIACVAFGLVRFAKRAPRALIGVLAPLLFLSFGVIAWSLLSGMELGLYFALFALLLSAAHESSHVSVLAALLVCLVLLRPEALLLSLVLSAGIARDRVALGFWRRIRVFLVLALPAMLAQACVFAANRALTGEMQSAGAILKLVTENPALDDAARMREVLTNLVTMWFGAFSRSTIAPLSTAVAMLCLCVVALRPRVERGVTLALLAAAPLLAILVSLNATARYQGFRYYVPALLCVLAVVVRGLFEMARRRPRAAALLSAALLAVTAPKLPVFREHFARAAGNIVEQQVEVGLRLARLTPPDARLLVGDAGAIPYFSQRAAIDALGLGGFHGMGFVRAATHGEGAILELLQRVPVAERPTHLAVYASWFPEITRAFGSEWFAVHLDDNVICGAPTKTVYHADWSHLGEHVPEDFVRVGTAAHLLDRLDFADLESERAHAFSTSPFAPTSVEVRFEDEDLRFDGCRRLAPNQQAQFVLRAASPARTTMLGLRGVGLQSARFTIEPAADARPTSGAFTFASRAPEGWELGTAVFAPARAAGSFAVRVLAGPGGMSLCQLWWRETD